MVSSGRGVGGFCCGWWFVTDGITIGNPDFSVFGVIINDSKACSVLSFPFLKAFVLSIKQKQPLGSFTV